MSEHFNHVVRDTLGKVYVFDETSFEMTRNVGNGTVTIDRKDGSGRLFGWFAAGQWVSAFSVSDDELDEVTGHGVDATVS